MGQTIEPDKEPVGAEQYHFSSSAEDKGDSALLTQQDGAHSPHWAPSGLGSPPHLWLGGHQGAESPSVVMEKYKDY